MTQSADNPEQRAHARLSASGSKRWMTCPGSIPYVETLPKELRSTSSKFAQLGTAAHTLGETCLNQGLRDSRSYEGWWINQQGDVTKDWRTWYKPKSRKKEAPEGWFQVDDNMMEAVDVYLSTVWAEMERLGPMATLQTERKFDLSWLRPEMFGTNDVNVDLFLEELVVIDYKHGQGVPVEIAYRQPDGTLKPNSQLMYYLLGAAQLEAFSHERYKLIVVQPRCPHPDGGVRSVPVTKAELLQFQEELAMAADRVREAEDMLVAAKDDETEMEAWSQEYLKAGPHCSSTFCDRLTTCRELKKEAQRVAMADFDDDSPRAIPVPDDLEVLARHLEWADVFTAWGKACAAQAQKLMVAGIAVPRHKLVLGKANRVFAVPETEVKARAAEIGIPVGDLYTVAAPKFISPAQLEKKGKKAKELVQGVYDKALDAWVVEPIAVKGQGKVKVAHESDPREAVPLDAALDFDDVPEYGQEDD